MRTSSALFLCLGLGLNQARAALIVFDDQAAFDATFAGKITNVEGFEQGQIPFTIELTTPTFQILAEPLAPGEVPFFSASSCIRIMIPPRMQPNATVRYGS